MTPGVVHYNNNSQRSVCVNELEKDRVSALSLLYKRTHISLFFSIFFSQTGTFFFSWETLLTYTIFNVKNSNLEFIFPGHNFTNKA